MGIFLAVICLIIMNIPSVQGPTRPTQSLLTRCQYNMTGRGVIDINVRNSDLSQHINELEGIEPNFDVPIVNVTAIATKTAILPCSVSTLGKYVVAWLDHREKILTLKEKRVISDDRISLERPYTNDWNLYIRDVKVSDSGKYMCQINTTPVKIKSVMLYVHERASIIEESSSSDTITREGATVQLICNATGIPPPVVTWYRRPSNSKEVPKEVVGEDGQVLIIHNISRYCEDTYECVAFNHIPPAASKEIKVTVQFAPEIFLPTKKIGQVRGKETILECKITANPQLYSAWLRNGKDIPQNTKYRQEVYEEDKNTITVSLRISDINEEDYGRYTCNAKNKLGEDDEDMELYEYIPPLKTDSPTTTTVKSLVIGSNNNWINSNTNEPGDRVNVHIPGYDSRNYQNGSSQCYISIILLTVCQVFMCSR